VDINQIKGGQYQLIAERWDETTSKPGEPFTFRRHRKGDKVTLSEADARRLVMAGAVVKPGEMERRVAAAALAQYRAALALVPDDLREHVQEPEQVVEARSMQADSVPGPAGGDDPVPVEKSVRRPTGTKS
jgi:hypothetical protein